MSNLNTIKFCIEVDDGDFEDVTYIDDAYVEGYCIDFDEIAKSLKSPGSYEIFTCGCGVAGCADIFEGVLVEHENEIIKWSLNQPYTAAYQFSKKQMFNALLEFCEYVSGNNIEIGSTLYAISGVNSTLDLLENVQV